MAFTRKSSRFRFWRSSASLAPEKPLAAASPAPSSSQAVVSAPVPEDRDRLVIVVSADHKLSVVSPRIKHSIIPPESSTPPTPADHTRSPKSAHQYIIPECCKADTEAQDVSSPWDEHVDDYVSAVIAIPHLSAMQRFEMLNRVNELLVPLKSE
ncbi:hypothetical protein BZA70DRAFT_297775 [Myxozyma melibiosi]|uniref:Uncharacterized protein n=1 Tax=Myxozyma melibiosi TaxID=54550 RepID=A0ABR1EY75_9ASCO